MAEKKKRKKLQLKLILFKALVFVIFFFSASAITLYFLVRSGAIGHMPSIEELSRIRSYTATKVISSDGKLLGLYYVQNRTNTSINNIPHDLIEALVATEDARFYHHNGFDLRGTLRAFFKSVLLFDRTAGGGSTISQQLAKNLYPRQRYRILSLPIAKIREAIIAMRMEEIYSKEEILELYLNTVSFGENTFGIETASLTFFNKTPDRLTTEESAMLVGMLKANTSYNPRLNEKGALTRRNTVLAQMKKYGYLDSLESDSLQKLPIRLSYHKLDHVEGPAPYFREFLRLEAARLLEDIHENTGQEYNLYTDGLVIHTTIDSRVQEYAEKAVHQQLAYLQGLIDGQWNGREPWRRDISLARLQIEQSQPYKKLRLAGMTDKEALAQMKKPGKTKVFTWKGEKDTLISPLDSILYHFGILQAGMLVMNGADGNVLAWVGGADYKYFKYDHVLSSRQVGSTIKPLLYAAAIDNGMDPCRWFENDSTVYEDFDNWSPQNANRKYGGYYTMKGALVHSVNTVSVKVLMECGIPGTIDKLKEMGISGEVPAVPSLALGSAEVPLYEMVGAYTVFLNKGKRKEPVVISSIETSDGKVIFRSAAPGDDNRVLSDLTAELVTSMMEQVVERGTASGLRKQWNIPYTLAGKTGTTQDQADAWFMGLTPELIAGVWVGGDNPVVSFHSLRYGQGAFAAMPVFARFIREIGNDRNTAHYTYGVFPSSDEAERLLDCEDFREHKGLRLFERPERQKTVKERPRQTTPSREKEESKIRKFFMKIFGKKTENGSRK